MAKGQISRSSFQKKSFYLKKLKIKKLKNSYHLTIIIRKYYFEVTWMRF